MKVEIGSVKIKVNKKTLTLTLKETQTLFNELNTIFGPKWNYSPFWSTQLATNNSQPLSSGTVFIDNGNSIVSTGSDGFLNTETSKTAESNILNLDLTNKGN